MDWTHVYPLNDLREHNIEGFDCECNPDIDWKYNMIIHFAFDGRDLIENIENNISQGGC